MLITAGCFRYPCSLTAVTAPSSRTTTSAGRGTLRYLQLPCTTSPRDSTPTEPHKRLAVTHKRLASHAPSRSTALPPRRRRAAARGGAIAHRARALFTHVSRGVSGGQLALTPCLAGAREQGDRQHPQDHLAPQAAAPAGRRRRRVRHV